MPQNFHDARDLIRWGTISFSLATAGSWLYENFSGEHEGTIGGTDGAVLHRKDFDRTKSVEQQLDEDEMAFVSYREIRSLHQGSNGPPLILAPFSFPGSTGDGAFTHSVDGSEQHGSGSFALALIDKEGRDWGDPETTIYSIRGTITFPSGPGRFRNEGNVIPGIVGEVFLTVPWTGGSVSQTIEYDILAPSGSFTPLPGAIMGSGSITISAGFS